MTADRTARTAGAVLGVLLLVGSFAAGRVTAPQADPLVIPTESRVDCLEVRLAAPGDGSDGLVVKAWLWDGDGTVRWTRELDPRLPLDVLFDSTDAGQDAVDLSHWYAEQEIEP